MQEAHERMAAHHEKWSDLPSMPATLHLPVMDGDIAYLHELRDRIYELLEAGAQPQKPGIIARCREQITNWVTERLINRINSWPQDEAEQLLTAWRDQ